MYDVTTLTPGQAYFFKVSAINSVGAGAATVSTPAYATPKAAPTVPATIAATTPTKSSTSSRSHEDVEGEPVAKKQKLVLRTIIYDESVPNQWLDEPPLEVWDHKIIPLLLELAS